MLLNKSLCWNISKFGLLISAMAIGGCKHTSSVQPTPISLPTDTPTNVSTSLIFSPTSTLTPVITASSTFSPTGTTSYTSTLSPTATDTSTFLLTMIPSPTQTPSWTSSSTGTFTITNSPTDSPSPSLTATISVTPTSTVTPSMTATSTQSSTITATPTNSITDTPTATPSETSTATNLNGYTSTPTSTPCYFGHNGTSFSKVLPSSNTLCAAVFTLSISASVTALSVWNPGYYTGNIRGAIFSDQSGSPSALIGETAELSLSTGTADWTVVPFSVPLDLAAGTYWLAENSDNNLILTLSNPGTASVTLSYSYGAFPQNFPGGGSSSSPYGLMIRALYPCP